MPTIEIDEGRLYYQICGEGEPVLFIPGLGGDHRNYHWQADAHARHFSCILFDSRMTGKSRGNGSSFSSGGYTVELLASDILQLLDGLEIGRAHIVGGSMGGVVAQVFALAHPERVQSLSLHSTWAKTSALLKLNLETQVRLVEQIGVADLLRSLAPWVWSEETLRERVDQILAYRDLFAEDPPGVDGQTYKLQAEACIMIDLVEKLYTISVPTLVTAGSDDILIPPRDSELVHRKIKGSEYHLFQGCGHGAALEKPEEFNSVSINFLQRSGG